jgi:DNA-binding beta-propeller fold protein YncE
MISGSKARKGFFREVLILFAAILLTAAPPSHGQRKPFEIPSGMDRAIWEAEKAVIHGKWKVLRTNLAHGGSYVWLESGSILEFPFEVREPTTLRIHPIWWRHGERKTAIRFPFPLPRVPGPDVIDIYGDFCFFTAPAAGKVAVLDLRKEEVIEVLDIGGYPSDLIVNGELGKMYVADAVFDRVLVFDAKSFGKLSEIPVPKCPWSMAIKGNNLYVACREGSALVRVDMGRDAVTGRIELPWEKPFGPVRVAVTAGESPRIVVWGVPNPLDLETFRSLSPEKEVFPAPSRKRVSVGGKIYEVPSPHTIRVRIGNTYKSIDVKAVTGAPGIVEKIAPPMTPSPGPEILESYGNSLFFSSPFTGKIGVVDSSKDELVGSIEIGGYIADMALDAKNGLLYVADATKNRIVIVDAGKRSVVAEKGTGPMPWSLAIYGTKLFLSLWRGRELYVYELPKMEPLKSIAFTSGIAYIVIVDPPDIGWWGNIPDELIPVVVTRSRIAVQMAPLAFDPESLLEVGSDDISPQAQDKRRSVVWKDGGKTVSVNNDHIVAIGDKLIDVSEVTDHQLLPSSPLTSKDLPGTISIRMDDGPEHDWMRGIWITPDQGLFLVQGTEEFWRWNSLSFELHPGRHLLSIKANSPYAMLDGIEVSRTLDRRLLVEAVPDPPESHWVFYHDEVPKIVLSLKNAIASLQKLRVRIELRNYMGEILSKGEMAVELPPDGTWKQTLVFEPKDRGDFELSVMVSSPDGDLLKTIHFLVLPKLEHPRMLFRKEEVPDIAKRMERFKPLFERFFSWMRERCQQEGFLPKGFTTESAVSGETAWRRYDLAWNMLSLQFAAIFSPPPDRDLFAEKLSPLLKLRSVSTYCTFHHHGPFFPGAVAALFDMAAMNSEDARKAIQEIFGKYIGNMDLFPWTAVAIEEPLDQKKRAILFKILVWSVNWQRYFSVHAGRRGGTWWLNPRTGCHCPFAGYVLSSLYLRNLFGQKRMFEKGFYSGFLTFHDYLRPYRDNKDFLASQYGPRGHARWLLGGLTRHPLEKRIHRWNDVLQALIEGREEPVQWQALERFRQPDSMCVIPLSIALGWYDPDAPEVDWKELPPTILFDAEGWAVMRSGWDEDLTEVNFICGIRDHVYRHQPTDFMIAKAGEFLIGTASIGGDHGCPTKKEGGGSWGNVVVIGDLWKDAWWNNHWHRRGNEYAIINRFSRLTFDYISRDRRLFGYAPAEGGYGGGLDFHDHTESAFIHEGEILAYETWPEFDYIAGDATNSWLPDEAEEVYRQLVFVKPDVVVLYDRVVLGPVGEKARWIAATGPDLYITPRGFTIENGGVVLHGDLLLPKKPIFQVFSSEEYHDLFQKESIKQRVLEISDGEEKGKRREFLIAMVVGKEGLKPLDARISKISKKEVVVEFYYKGKRKKIGFRREGDVGGWISSGSWLWQKRHRFVEYIEDSYGNWKEDPRYKMWMEDRRFDFLELR